MISQDEAHWCNYSLGIRYTIKASWLSNTNYVNTGGWTPDETCPNGSYATAYTMEVCFIYNYENTQHNVQRSTSLTQYSFQPNHFQ